MSAAILSFEILLVRVFAIEHFHHFAYMAIGVAMLGFGGSGAFIAGLGARGSGLGERLWHPAILLTPFALVASPALVHAIDLDATRLAWDVGQWVRVAAMYVILAVPFWVGALAILSALTLEHERPGALYGASFFGAALGAGLAIGVLWIASPTRALAAPAVLAALAAAIATHGAWRWAAAAVSLAALAVPPWRLTVTPYKALPQVEAYPDARRVAEQASPVGWSVAVRAPAFRHAPGLSLGYRGSFPVQTALFSDGDLVGAAADWSLDPGARALLDWLPSAMAYAHGPRDRVLVVGAGDGLETWSALEHGARRVTAVELSPDIVRFVQQLSSPSLADDRRVAWEVGDGRSYVAGSKERFDLITLGPGGSFGTTAAGVHALSEDFLHTVDAYVAYLARLDDDGVLAITRWVTVPPRASVRVILTAGEALHRASPADARQSLVVGRGWGTATVLVKPSGFEPRDVEQLRVWAGARGFDLDWYPGLVAPPAGMHALDEPVLFQAARTAAAGADSARRFADAYPFDVRPATDARPFPHHFLRAGSLGAFLTRARGEWLPFAEWGYVALVATLVQSAALAAVFMLLPAAWRASRPVGRVIAYFGSVGFGYLAAEIAAIQVLGLLLGHPIYGVAAVFAVLLGCSGAGSGWSDRIVPGRARAVGAALAALLVLYSALLLPLAHGIGGAGVLLRVLVAVAALVPLAFLMGAPFPLGLRGVASGPGSIAWAWAANGFASVVAAPLAALIGIELGSPALFLAAAAAYGVAALVGSGKPQNAQYPISNVQ